MPLDISLLSVASSRRIDTTLRNYQIQFWRPNGARILPFPTIIPHIATKFLTFLHSSKARRTDTLVLLKQSSTQSNSEGLVTNQFIQLHTAQGLWRENSRSRKQFECVPWTLTSTRKRNWPHRFSSSLRSSEVLSFALIIASWTQWRPEIYTRYHTWTSVSVLLVTWRYFPDWRPIADIDNSKLPGKIGIKLPLRFITASFVLFACLLEWKKRRRRFNEQWKSYWWKSSGNLSLSI